MTSYLFVKMLLPSYYILIYKKREQRLYGFQHGIQSTLPALFSILCSVYVILTFQFQSVGWLINVPLNYNNFCP
jgi:hypothetical protein